MGATVTGVDAVEKNIKIARLHSVWFLLLITQIKNEFYVLLCSIMHVNVFMFMQNCIAKLKYPNKTTH